jgi:hypothetical protein
MAPRGARAAFVVGGPVPLSHPAYVKRAADDQLYEELKRGALCCVLDSRQMGKTSLRNRAGRRLEADGFRCVAIDLSGIGQAGCTPDQWYGGILHLLVGRLGLTPEYQETLNDPLLKGADWLEQFRYTFDKVILPGIPGGLVILFDEIDQVLKYDFDTDSFFAFMRAIVIESTENEQYQRLRFALFGVATPADLIKNKQITSFNVGTAIELNGFTFEEARALLPGLSRPGVDAEALLREIIVNTGGQPFLTQ